MSVSPYEVVAHNTATQSDNKIHDDEVARRYGFSGGLVPGVDVYAYLTHIPAREWGLGWLGSGTMRGRFLLPVYEGAAVTVTAERAADGSLELELRSDGLLCATGAAAEGVPGEAPLLGLWPLVEQRSDPPTASPESLAPGTPFGLAEHRFRADKAVAYLDEVRERLPFYRDAGVAHPGWLLRDANYVLAANVRLGPWIHVESVVQHHAAVRDGERVSARAVVQREWERKGHRFVDLDVAIVADDHIATTATHTAIHTPRTT